MNNNNNSIAISIEPTTEIVLNADYVTFSISKKTAAQLPSKLRRQIRRKHSSYKGYQTCSFRTHPRVIEAIRNVWKEDTQTKEDYSDEYRQYIRKIPTKLKEYVKFGYYDGKEWVVYDWEKWLLNNLHFFRPEHQQKVQRLVQCALDEESNPMELGPQCRSRLLHENQSKERIRLGNQQQTEQEPTIEIAVNGNYGGFHLSRAMKHRLRPELDPSVVQQLEHEDISFRTNPAVIQAIRDTWRLGEKDEDGNCLPLEEETFYNRDDFSWDICIRKTPECLEHYVVIGENDGKEWIEYEWDRWMRHNLDLFKEEEKENMIRLLECVKQEVDPMRWERPQRYQHVPIEVFTVRNGFGSCA